MADTMSRPARRTTRNTTRTRRPQRRRRPVGALPPASRARAFSFPSAVGYAYPPGAVTVTSDLRPDLSVEREP